MVGSLGTNPDGFFEIFEKGRVQIRTKLRKFLKRPGHALWTEILFQYQARFPIWTYVGLGVAVWC